MLSFIPSAKRISSVGPPCSLWIGLAGGLIGTLLTAPPALAETKTVPAVLVAGAIEGLLSGSQLHLNNYGPRHGNSWHKPNDSFVLLSPPLGGTRLAFDLPEVRVAAGRRYYISDFNLQGVSVVAEATSLKATLRFESGGTELKGRCAGDFTCFGASDNAAPDFNVNNARVEIPLTPVKHGRDLAWGPVNASFHANVDGNGIGELLEGRVQREIRRAVESNVEALLNRADVKDRAAAELRRRVLDPAGIGTINSVRIAGGNLVIDHTPATVMVVSGSIATTPPRPATPPATPAAGRPDLGAYGFLKIGRTERQVRWGETILLTPADATLVSGGRPAFEVFYAYREFNGVAVPGPFKNQLVFNGTLVSQQTNLAAGAREIKNVHTQAYLGPGNGRLELKIDADNTVAEAREDNNAGFFVNVVLRGF